MHREFFRLYRKHFTNGPLESRPPRRTAIAAPRGYAKSTFETLIIPLHATLYAREGYIIILSATLKQAEQRLKNIKSELEANRLLKDVFREELARRGQWTDKSIQVNNVQIDVYSAGTEIRGISHRQWRPTLVLLDDIEDSKSAYSSDRRDKLYEWYNEVIENIGDTYTAVEIIGTLLHPDSLLARLLRRPDFESYIFKSIDQFAERTDLWEEWRKRFTNLSDAERLETARAFFNQNRAEMLRGTRVQWQSKEDYYELMTQLTTHGRAAFFKEKQNSPSASEEAFFDLARAIKFQIHDSNIIY